MKRRLSVSFFHHDTSVCVQFYMYEGLGKALVLVILYLTIAQMVRFEVRKRLLCSYIIYRSCTILYSSLTTSQNKLVNPSSISFEF